MVWTQTTALTDVRIDPSADLDVVFRLDFAQVFLGIRKVDGIPSE